MSQKANARGNRLPTFASRDTCAAEFEICTATWDAWVKAGVMPKPYNLGDSGATVRWLWTEVLDACEAMNTKAKAGDKSFCMNLSVLRRQHEAQGKATEGRS